MKIRPFLAGFIVIALALTAISCGGKKNIKNVGADDADMVTDTSTMPTLDITESTDTTGGEALIRGGDFVSMETIRTVHFDFDRYALSDETRETLKKNADIIKTHRDWTVMVEGHCDSRGTIEYNLALGQKRAKEVRDYYIRLGVPDSSLGTISYGKEKPLCEDETEECWSANRRAETKVRAQ